MREILFRGKAIDGNWCYGVPLVFTEDYVCMTAPHTYNKKVEANTMGQFTGLTDKNGKKIFEGDIIEFNNDLNKTKWRVVFGMNYGYGINSPCFMLKDFRNATTPFNEKMVIIGNIHDNPELLHTPQNDEVRE